MASAVDEGRGLRKLEFKQGAVALMPKRMDSSLLTIEYQRILRLEAPRSSTLFSDKEEAPGGACRYQTTPRVLQASGVPTLNFSVV